MTEKTLTHPFDRIMSWLLPAVVALTPFAICYTLRANVAQAFFLQAAAAGLLGALGVAWMAGWRPLRLRLSFPGGVLALNVLAILLSLGASRQWVFSLRQALLPASGVIFFGMLVAQPGRRKVLGRIQVILAALGGMLALHGIAQHFGHDFLDYAQLEKNSVVSTLGHPNYLASVLGPVLFLVLGLAVGRTGLVWKVAGAGVAFVILLCVMLAQTRAMWLGIALGGVVATTLGARFSARRGLEMRWLAGLSLGALIIAIGLAVMLFKVLPGSGRDVDMQARIASSQEAKARVYYWRAAIDLAAKKPLFGQGYAMFDPLFWDYALEHQKQPEGVYYYDVLPAVTGRTPGHVHNEYLEVLAEEGWFGFAALTALLGFFLFFGGWAVMRQPTQRQALQGAALYGALVSILIDAMFGFPWRLPVSLLVFAVVLAGLYDLVYPQEETAKQG